MNEKINLVKILKDCPKGTKLYSPIFGDVVLKEVSTDDRVIYPIIVLSNWHSDEEVNEHDFSREGIFCKSYKGAECTIFPSKNQRDWSKFECPKPKFDLKTLQPFDRILGRNDNNDIWNCDLFSHIHNNNCYTSSYYLFPQVVPYNEDTKHLVGTKNEAPEYYRYWED